MNIWRTLFIFSTLLSTPGVESYMRISDGACPADLSDCLRGEDQALKCYQAVEKIRVSCQKRS